MKKHFYLPIFLTTFFFLKGFSQAFPPVINSYSDSLGSTSLVLYINYTANDTGTILAQIELSQGTGHIVYDSTYSLQAPANDSGVVQLYVGPISRCTDYQLTADLSNSHAQGQVNSLIDFTTLCTTGIPLLNENNYSLIALEQNVEIKTISLPENGTIEIYDITGKLVLSLPFNQSVQQIPFNKNAGIYLLRITGNNKVLFTNRFVTY